MSELLRTLNNELAAMTGTVHRSLVQINNGRRGGSGAGTIWQADGLILTNAHVVRQQTPEVTLPDGRTITADIIAYDEQRDLATLSVAAHGLPTLPLGDSSTLRAGDWVMAIGHPWGILGAASAGFVIDVGWPLGWSSYRGELVQTSLTLRPGHSGGPMVNGDGQLIGINTMISGPKVGLAVPINVAKQFMAEHIRPPTNTYI
ncbi:MAG: trypsin-like peptidase domain-containing protein [Anaerolineales bacterium]|nr:trypsin-like peptidase domain-containing protein [Anaerolineales bacterium]